MIKHILAAIALSAPACADTWTSLALDQLACHTSPDPGPVLQDMARQRLIDTNQNLGIDSVSCFAVPEGTQLAGLAIASVCGFEADAEQRAKHGNIFHRSAGTPPPQLLSFGTPADRSAALAWYKDTVASPHAENVVMMGPIYEDELVRGDEQTFIACTGWFAR